jgi:hypothetical protein
MNLMEGLLSEIDRVKDLIKIYEELPDNAGAFGAMMLKTELKLAQRTIADGDTVRMLGAYQSLKECE